MKHKLTATLIKKDRYPPFKKNIVDEVDEEFFNIYNTDRRISELEYLGYTDIKLVKGKDRVENQSANA